MPTTYEYFTLFKIFYLYDNKYTVATMGKILFILQSQLFKIKNKFEYIISVKRQFQYTYVVNELRI